MLKDPKLFGSKAVVQVIIQPQVQVFGEFSLSSSSGMIRIHLSLNEGSMKGEPYPSQELWERQFKPYSPTC